MRLWELLRGVDGYDLAGDPEQEVAGLAYDSRRVESGFLFVALRGHLQDGHRYLQGAVQRGAVAIVGEEIGAVEGRAAKVRVPDSRRALSRMALEFYAHPFGGIEVIGITGTNGKTTTTYLLESILLSAGARPGVIGTVNYRFSGKTRPAPVTTPESLDLVRLVREMVDGGATHVIMEVSSHALAQGRTEDCPFRVGVFTNLSRDHLDYHGTMEDYFQAKSRLFRVLKRARAGAPGAAVINLDDPRGRELAEISDTEVITYGLGEEAGVWADSVSFDRSGIKTRVKTPAGEIWIRSPLIGGFNLYNILASASAALALGVGLEDIAHGIERLRTVPGRLELVENHEGLSLVVDYAHTPDALLKALRALRPYVQGRLITVFGCGGDRDRGKRPEMGRVAGEESDLVFITSDNPRSEDPQAILMQIEEGIRKTRLREIEWPPHDEALKAGYVMEVDRRKAIRSAVSAAGKEDLVLIAGKGHEDYQIIGSERRPFDDRVEAALAAGRRD